MSKNEALPMFKYHIVYVLYPFSYSLTLPRASVQITKVANILV
jgi:hypothetical protein